MFTGITISFELLKSGLLALELRLAFFREGVDRFHEVFADQDGGILLSHVFQPGFDTVLAIKPHHVFDPLNSEGEQAAIAEASFLAS